MERLWTPWRMSYVAGSGSGTPGGGSEEGGEGGEGGSGGAGDAGACFLCAVAADPAGERDPANLVLFRGHHGFVLLNRFPYNTGHLMIAPYEHTGDLVALAPETGHELYDLTRRAVAALRAEYRPDGFNVGLNLGQAAGAGVPGHLHVHAVPRWSGDTNFMPVLGQTKVLPEALDQTWARLKPRFDP
jgi:ATP adenylyltransferase